MNLSERAFQRLSIATHLIEDSTSLLSRTSDPSVECQEPLQNLAVALYELKQLSQELEVLMDSSSTYEQIAARLQSFLH